MEKKSLGIHIIAELYGCNPALLDDEKFITDTLVKSAKKTKVTVIDHISQKFEPQGVSAVIIISESHLAIHTWPEFSYAALDFYTCGQEDPEPAVREIAESLGARDITIFRTERGNIEKIKLFTRKRRESKKSKKEDTTNNNKEGIIITGENGESEKTRTTEIQVLL